MKAIIVCGSRYWTDAAMLRGVLAAVHAELGPEEWLLVIEGQARGADKMAGEWADEMITEHVGHAKFPADWTTQGKAAGPIRNGHQLDHLIAQRDDRGADIEVITFADDLANSRGTKDMVTRAQKAGVLVTVHSHIPAGVTEWQPK